MQPKASNNIIFWSISTLVIAGLVAAIIAVRHYQKAPKTVSEELAAVEVKPADPKAAEGVKDAPTLVLELFNPTDQVLNKRVNEATVRQNIEQILSTSFALSNCGLVDSDTSRDSFRASVMYAINTKYAKDGNDAILKIQKIQKAASATYEMLYRNTNCKNPKLPAIAKQMREWQEHYLAQK
jgi:hypothetical protein